MTDKTPPTQAGSSYQRPMLLPTYSTGSNILPYGSWGNLWSSHYSGYAVNPHFASGYAAQRPTQSKAPSKSTENDFATSSSKHIMPTLPPALPDPDTYQHWDDILKNFLEKTKLTQSRRGLDVDMLVLNPEWEQRILPDALKDLVHGMQVILDRIPGKANSDTQIHATTLLEQRPLDERKLDYVQLRDGKKPEPQSSVTKSISQFLARSRARNDLSNRAEFLQTLSEQKRALIDSSSTVIAPEVEQVSSCARVDAKTIDRAKQIKYDIMKNEDGPLTRTASIKPPASDSAVATQSLSESAGFASSTSAIRRSSPVDEVPRKRRRLGDVQDPAKHRPKFTTTEGDPPVLLPQKSQDETDGISPTFIVSAIDERIRNIEEHLSVRYVPSPPQTLLTRLKYLEDHLIRLEKEYPPWAALHFKQPNRGWPPPPRSTPIIVPPHLRSTTRIQSSSRLDPVQPTTSIPNVIGQQAKPRQKNSTLHKAVMDRLEIQQAMNEMGLQ